MHQRRVEVVCAQSFLGTGHSHTGIGVCVGDTLDIWACGVNGGMDKNTRRIYRVVGVFNDTAININLDQIRGFDLAVVQAEWVDQEVLFGPWYLHGNMVVDHFAPTHIVEDSIAGCQLDSQFLFCLCHELTLFTNLVSITICVPFTRPLFICGGAFAGLDKVIQNRSDKGGIGFSADVKAQSDKKDFAESLQDLEAEDLVQYGLIPEFVGRLPMIATLEELDVGALVQILTEPKNALTKQYHKMFDMEGVEIDFREDGLTAVATKAMERKTGARGLRSILENVLLESMYNIPSQAGVAKIVVDESVINGDSEPLLVYETPDESIAAQDA